MGSFGMALDVDTAKTVASSLSAGSIVIAVVALILVKNMVMRIVTLVLFLALGMGSWSQRANLVDCADKMKAAAGTAAVSCTFFGQDVEIPAVTD